MVVDDLGIYFDYSRASRLEGLICRNLTVAETARAQAVMTLWRSGRVSKYNYAREYRNSLPERFVLVADQTAGDQSIQYGGADHASFHRMLEAALDENPDCMVVLKTHPDVVSGRKRGHFDIASVSRNPRIIVLNQDVHPVSLLEKAEIVYVVTSQLGFEGLLWGCPVRTFGMPFYAGWGLTQDALPVPARRKPVALEQLVHASLVDYPRYIDPETAVRCEVERVIEWLALQRRMRERFSDDVHAIQISRWKRPIVRSFFQGSRVTFQRSPKAIPAGATAALWGRKPIRGALPPGIEQVRIEDGFVRSVGLGGHPFRPIRPLSWVMDRRGIYYDSTCESDLELLLQTTEFPPEMLLPAARLRERILDDGVTKYNVGAGGWVRPSGPHRVILVPGQVEDDASIRFGAPGIKTCMGLLRAVREANPDAMVIYKPHPDVEGCLRPAGAEEDKAPDWCDAVLRETAMGTLLPQVDEVHLLSSLTGFEALLRGKEVTCYGQPFYAGWGLTHDIIPVPRRTRRLTLDMLVAGALIAYPTYISRTTGRFTTPERALDELSEWRSDIESAWGSRKLVTWFRRQQAKMVRTPGSIFGIRPR
jgi:capsular polysaccharide export protein